MGLRMVDATAVCCDGTQGRTQKKHTTDSPCACLVIRTEVSRDVNRSKETSTPVSTTDTNTIFRRNFDARCALILTNLELSLNLNPIDGCSIDQPHQKTGVIRNS